MHIASIGIDLGKTTFHLVALGERSKVLVRKKFSRTQLLVYTADLPSPLIGPEACSGAHFVGAALREQGYDVRLIPTPVIATISRTVVIVARNMKYLSDASHSTGRARRSNSTSRNQRLHK